MTIVAIVPSVRGGACSSAVIVITHAACARVSHLHSMAIRTPPAPVTSTNQNARTVSCGRCSPLFIEHVFPYLDQSDSNGVAQGFLEACVAIKDSLVSECLCSGSIVRSSPSECLFYAFGGHIYIFCSGPPIKSKRVNRAQQSLGSSESREGRQCKHVMAL